MDILHDVRSSHIMKKDILMEKDIKFSRREILFGQEIVRFYRDMYIAVIQRPKLEREKMMGTGNLGSCVSARIGERAKKTYDVRASAGCRQNRWLNGPSRLAQSGPGEARPVLGLTR